MAEVSEIRSQLIHNSGYTINSLVRCRRRLQCYGYGFPWTIIRRSIQLLQKKIHNKDDFDDCGSNDLKTRVPSQ